MEFKLLGTLEVVLDGDQAVLPVRAKERCLLAALLVNTNRALPMWELIRCAWDDEDPQEATFRSYLTHVRAFLARTDGEARVTREEGGYRLRVDPDCIDLHRFRRLQDQAAAAVAAGHTDEAVALLCEAESIWRGEALAGLESHWVLAIQASLDDERLACIKRRVGLELDQGRHAELAGELRRLSARYPVDEAFIAFEMTALYWSGRQAEALALYPQARSRLFAHGIEPGPDLAALHQRILRQDLQRPGAESRRRASARRPATVPTPAGTFVGRAEQLGTIVGATDDAPQVFVISGMPGVGKTRLAVEAVSRLTDRYPDGQLFLEFHAHQAGIAPLGADEATRRLLEMTGAGLPHRSPPSGKELAALWQDELKTSRMIIVLDDVPDTEAVAPLLPKVGRCAILITARQRLAGIGSASEVTLIELPEHDAIRLFTVTSGTPREDEPEAVAQIVRALGCHPLALTVAASQLRESGGPSTATELIGDITESGILQVIADVADGQLMSALEASYKALTSDQQRFFRLLGISPCLTFTAESAAASAVMPIPLAQEMTAALLDRHLVERTAGDRIRLHDVLRTYAAFCAERDSSPHERRDAQRRMLDYYLRTADHADRHLYPHRERAAGRNALQAEQTGAASAEDPRAWLEAEWRNALEAAGYAARHEWKRDCAELAHVLAEFLYIRGCWDEAFSLHTIAVRACRDLGDQRLIARALVDLSSACQQKGAHQSALAYAREALVASQSVGDQHGAACAADRMGIICYFTGRFRDALAHKQEARVLYAESGDPSGEAKAVFHCGVSSLNLGRLSDSLQHFRQALASFRQSGNEYWAAKTLNSMGDANMRQGYHREALVDYQEALSIYRDMGARQEHGVAMQNLGKISLYKGNPERALTEFKYALATYRETHDLLWQARVMCDLGDAHRAMDDYEQSIFYYQQAGSTAGEVGDLLARTISLRGLGDAYRLSDRPKEAMRYYRAALKTVQEIEEPYEHAVIVDGMAKTMFRIGRNTAGRVYLRQALDLYETTGAVEAAIARMQLEALGGLSGDTGNHSIAQESPVFIRDRG